MSNPTTFVNNYSENIVQFVKLIETLRLNNAQIDQDSTLLDRYFSPTPPAAGQFPPPPRNDITKAQVMAAHDALVQILFTYDSGTPTVKAGLFAMQP